MLKLKVRCIINFTLLPDSAVGEKAKKKKQCETAKKIGERI